MECRLLKKKNLEANVVDAIPQGISYINFSIVVSKVNLVGSNSKEWWINTGATGHVCSSRDLFITFQLVNREKIFMGNSTSYAIEGQGKMVLKMALKNY